MVVFILALLSDVLGVEVFLLTPTVSDGDGDGPRFCAPVPPSPPRFGGIALITLDEFPSTSSFFTLFFCWIPTRKSVCLLVVTPYPLFIYCESPPVNKLLILWVDRGTGTPKDRDKVNRRDV